MKLNNFSTITASMLLSTSLFAGFDSMNPLQSSSHNTLSFSQNKEISISWSQAQANSGDTLAGYYYILDNNSGTLMPNVVDTRKTLASVATSKVETITGSDGSYYFHLAPYANNANTGATIHFGPIKIDSTVPVALNISPDGGSFSSAQRVSMSAMDANNYTIYYTVDSSTPTKDSLVYDSPFQLSSSKTLRAIAIDSAGNESIMKTSSFNINMTTNTAQFGDEIQAGATIATNSDGNAERVISVLSVKGSLVTHYRYKIDSASFSSQIEKSKPIVLTSIPNGLHSISIIGYDGESWQADNSATTLTFTVDNIAPKDIEFSTASASIITENSTITMSSSDSDKIYYTIDGTTPSSKSIDSSSLSLSSSNNGTLTLKAIAYDKAGNRSAVKSAVYAVQITDTDTDTDNTSTAVGDTISIFFGKEVVNITSELELRRVTNSDGTIIFTASTTNSSNLSIIDVIQVNPDGTLQNSVTIGEDRWDIEVNVVGADTIIKKDGSMEVTSTVSNGDNGSVVSRVTVDSNGKMTNSVTVTKDGVSTKSTLNSDILGTDTVVSADGSIRVTTPTVTMSTGQKVEFEVVLNSSGEVTPSVTVDGESITLPQFDAGSTLNIKQELDKILLNIETILAKTITFN